MEKKNYNKWFNDESIISFSCKNTETVVDPEDILSFSDVL